ncbi:MAG: hypothetical protein ACHQ7M_05885 [Chloroflexota bacterium]
MMMIRKLILPVLALLVALGLAPSASAAADAELPSGHFFTEANGGAGADYGYRLSNEGGIGLWSEFQRLGGVAALGYPISRRFMLDGYVAQATQKFILEWRPDASPPRATFVNVFDKLHDLGQDSSLQSNYQIPPPLDPAVFDAGKSADQARTDRLTLLNADPAIAARYNFGGDPLLYNGLPTSAITNEGSFFTLRAQRTAIQHWMVANAAAGVQRGDVTLVNAGDIAKQLGVVPADAVQPETIAGQVLSAPAPPAAPAVGGGAPAPTTQAAAPAAPALLYKSKDVTTPPIDCSPDPLGSALPCVNEIGSLSTQFIRGRVMSAKADHLQWVVVQANIGGAVSSVQTNGDGTFYFQIAQGCPNYAIQAQLVVLDNAGRVASDTKTITYTGNCYLSGEFHFDFLRAN